MTERPEELRFIPSPLPAVDPEGQPKKLNLNEAGELKTDATSSGMRKGLRARRYFITSTTRVKIPPVPLTDRNAITIRVIGPDPLLIGGEDVTNTGETKGYPKYFKEEFAVDVKDNAETEVYGLVENAGESCEIAVMEGA